MPVSLSEHLADIGTIRVGELAGRLTYSVLIEYPLYRVEHVAGIFGRSKIGQHSILLNHSNNLRHLEFYRLFGVLNFLYCFVAFLGQSRQVVSEAQHAVVGAAVRIFLYRIFLGHPPGIFLASAKRGT